MADVAHARSARLGALAVLVLVAGCAPRATLQAIDGFDAAFDGAHEHRRLLALVSPS